VPLDPAGLYCYHLEQGPLQALPGSTDCLTVHGATLLALDAGQAEGEECHNEAKRLMRTALQPYLGNRPLASRELFRAQYGHHRQDKPDNNHEE